MLKSLMYILTKYVKYKSVFKWLNRENNSLDFVIKMNPIELFRSCQDAKYL